MIRAVARVNLALAGLLHYSPMLTPGKVRELQHPDWVCDTDKLMKVTDWRPKKRLQDALPMALMPADEY
jgi:hypothetical protein